MLVGDNTTAGGMAWLAVDKDCVLHYQVYVSGLDPKERHLLELLYIKPGKYGIPQQRVLKRFDGEQVKYRGFFFSFSICVCKHIQHSNLMNTFSIVFFLLHNYVIWWYTYISG